MPDTPTNAALAERLRAHVQQLAAEIGERNVFNPHALQRAEDYLRGVLTQQGYAVTAQGCTVRGVRSANLEASRPGSTRPGEILLVGAHYDSVLGSPGANDNGSGVACLLELAGLFSALRPQRTVRFVAFTNEEPPFFFSRDQGSLRYARAAKRRGDNIRLMIALETMGCYDDRPGSQHYPPLLRFFYPDQANFIAFISNWRSRPRLREFTAAFRASSDFPAQALAAPAVIPGVAWSDHLSFWRHGYRALMVTDTAFYRYPFYHTAEDSAEKLDHERLARVTLGISGALLRMADSA